MNRNLNATVLEKLENLDGYGRYFMHIPLWEPFVRALCQHHQLTCSVISTGLAGSYPTFLVDNKWVIKFFGELYNGERSFAAELVSNQIIAKSSILFAPKLLTHGELLPNSNGWKWPYLIFSFVDGKDVGTHYTSLPKNDKISMARWMGTAVHTLHQLPLAKQTTFTPSWSPYLDFLHQQRKKCVANHQKWESLPAHLIAQLDGYLLPVSELVDLNTPPHLIHADLTADHLFVDEINGRYHPTALIDFGDAMVGNILYELAALHFDMFHCNKLQLHQFLSIYPLPQPFQENFAHKAMSMALLHQFNVIYGVKQWRPDLGNVPTLHELADLLWK
ncbi:MAG: aminoglycoside phosphotransferase family protein [Chloroflexi bacterium]|nr:aminoglycoside phosphotransferase family protein [Chloroflexota bacterium]